MPATRGRPKVYKNGVSTITFKLDDAAYDDIADFAAVYGLSVPVYVSMMMNIHRNAVKNDERARKLGALDA